MRLTLCAAALAATLTGCNAAPLDATDGGGSGGDLASTSATGDGGASSCASDPATAANATAVLAAAKAFVATLPANQQAALQLDATLAHARQWSNLPTTFVTRNGVPFKDMSAESQAAALALARAAASTTGSLLFDELRAADQWLVTNGNASANDYGEGRYYVAFIGAPSASSPWMLQIAGHHLAYNFSYNARCTSATPLFDGVEPTSWTDGATTHKPLEAQRAAMVALLQSVGSIAEAKLSGTYTDIVAGPSGSTGDSRFPGIAYPTGTSGRGVSVASLTAGQQALVKAAIEAWVDNAGDAVASALLGSYESAEALGATYVGYSGSTDLTAQNSYARIDGPRVWIEVTIQGGIVYKNMVHYHTIWRDKAADYGAEYN